MVTAWVENYSTTRGPTIVTVTQSPHLHSSRPRPYAPNVMVTCHYLCPSRRPFNADRQFVDCSESPSTPTSAGPPLTLNVPTHLPHSPHPHPSKEDTAMRLERHNLRESSPHFRGVSPRLEHLALLRHLSLCPGVCSSSTVLSPPTESEKIRHRLNRLNLHGDVQGQHRCR
jgi:hypothetical protein